jgi:adenylate cyclase
MQGPLGWIAPVKRPRPGLTADFRRALTREILLTERLRVKAILITFSVLMGSLTAVYLIFPDVVERIWRQFSLVTLLTVYAGAAAFELWVLWLIGRWLAMGKDLPLANRYLGAAVEASLPTIALYFHMSGMGAAPALAFVAPLAYFIFIILSTLRLDFWLSSFTGAVAAIELFAMAMLYHPPQFIGEPQPDFGFHLVRSMMLLVCGLLAGAVGVQLRRQFEASIAAAGARDRVTNLFGQHVSPQVVERLLASGAPTAARPATWW